MRQVLMILLISSFVCCNTKPKGKKETNNKDSFVEFEFLQDFHNFGTLEAGETVAFSFEVKCIGTADLIIENVETDCGCIQVDYPESEIKPDETRYIEVVFNSAGEVGKVYKTITVFTNAENEEKELTIAATVNNKMINLYSKN